jgi:hypothetical protein
LVWINLFAHLPRRSGEQGTRRRAKPPTRHRLWAPTTTTTQVRQQQGRNLIDESRVAIWKIRTFNYPNYPNAQG